MLRTHHCWTACVVGILAFGAAPGVARAASAPDIAEDIAHDGAPAADAEPVGALPEVAVGQGATLANKIAPLLAKPKRNIYAGDYLVIGIGVAALPAYEGSHHNHVIPAFGLGGRIHGIGISPRTLGFALNFIPPRASRIGLSLGPVIRYRGARAVAISDPTPIRVGNSKGNLELGVNASISLKRIFSKYDSVSVSTDVRWDASNGTGSMVVGPGISYFTPISHSQVVGISASADIYNQSFAKQSYTVSSSGPSAAGVTAPVGIAPRAGLRSVGGRIFTAYDLDHNLQDGGFSIVLGIGYSRLMGAAARSPLVKNGGSHDQVVIGTGLAFAFKTGR